MRTAIDSSVLFDILKSAPGAAEAQQALEEALSRGSLCVCAIVIAELGRYFDAGDELLEFLAACQIEHDPLSIDAAIDAARIMRSYARNKDPRDRVALDFLIGSHALTQADALITTDAGFFRHYFKGLKVVAL
jgi:predicted nucleic acid-binding protein